MSTARLLLEQYARTDPTAASYLRVYDAIMRCHSDPQACATAEAKRRLMEQLSQETGVPIADIERCANDPTTCAQSAVFNAASAYTGISPEVLNLAMSCAQGGDGDACAKAALTLAAVAACSFYTSGVGTTFCTKAAPIVVDFAWPHIRNVMNAVTFGVGIDGVIDVLTLGQGLKILKPIGTLVSSVFGESKSEFSKDKKRKVFDSIVGATNGALNGAIVGLWEGERTRRQGIAMPFVDLVQDDPGIRQRVAERWRAWHDRDRALLMAYEFAKSKKNSGRIQELIAFVDAERKLAIHREVLKPPWPVPAPESASDDALVAREVFIDFFHMELRKLGFYDSARRSSTQGKIVYLNGGDQWSDWGYDKVCSECTKKDVEVFVSMVTKLFVEHRIMKLEPAILHFIDAFASDYALKSKRSLSRSSFATKASLTMVKPSFSIVKRKTIIPNSLLTRNLSPSLELPEPPFIRRTINLSSLHRRKSAMARAWDWARANPDYGIPAATAGVAAALLALLLLRRKAKRTGNVDGW